MIITDDKKAEISVVIPCYNEYNRINKCFIELIKFFFKNRDKFIYEILFVDDGSTDDTYERLEYLSEDYQNIRVLTYSGNAGKGYAVRKGILEAKYENVLILDADLSIKPDNILRVFYMHNAYADNPYMIQGKRRFIVEQPFLRQLSGVLFKEYVKLLFKLPVKDTQAPFKILHKIPKADIELLKENGFSYDVELLYKLSQKYSIHETIVDFYDDRESKVTLKKAIKMFFELWKLKFG